MRAKEKDLELLRKEIDYIIDRNKKDELFLRYIISCMISYEKNKTSVGIKPRAIAWGLFFFLFLESLNQFLDDFLFFIGHIPVCLDDSFDEIIIG